MTASVRTRFAALALLATVAAAPALAETAPAPSAPPPHGAMMMMQKQQPQIREEMKAHYERMEAVHAALADARARLEKGENDKAFLAKLAADLAELERGYAEMKAMREKVGAMRERMMQGRGGMMRPSADGGEPAPAPMPEVME